jgi:hypothetical protein
MNRVRSFAKYQLWDFRISVMVYYAILVAIALFMVVRSGSPGDKMSLSGSSLIFIFVVGLNCFKQSFFFAQANNISRRTFHSATIVALIALAAILSVADFVLDSAMSGYPFYAGLFEQMYQSSWMAKILWTMSVLTFFASLGWMITMLYYRANPIVKWIISVVPIALIMMFVYTYENRTGSFGSAVVRILALAFGFSGEIPNPYPAILTFTLSSVALWAVNYLLMYRVPVKVH